MPLCEVCVDAPDGALAAQQGGADRVELCAALAEEGGLTPSLCAVRATLCRVGIPVHVMLRPRGGGFVYTQSEHAAMLADAVVLRDAGAAGIVLGSLLPDGTVDLARTMALVAACRPASVTFHKAFDVTPDPFAALDGLIGCGVDRVLTSGQAATGADGAALLRALTVHAQGRIIVLGCGGLRPATVGAVAWLREVHFAAPAPGGGTDAALVAATIAAARQAGRCAVAKAVAL